ncbi:MAG: metallophosphoesterase [Planctomycetota bacterium]|jgi:predicted MPP superfamily phosphohydrolase
MNDLEKISLLIFLLIIAAIYCTEAVLLLRYFLGKIIKNNLYKKHSILSKPAVCLHVVAVIGILCILYGFFIEPYWIEVNTIPIQTPKLKNTSLKIVHFSDLHCDLKIRNEKKLIEIINSLDPDIIVFTGDCINHADALPLFRYTLKALDADIAKFGVYGNWCRLFDRLNLFKDTGFQLLNSKKIEVTKNGEKFSISGTHWSRKPNISNLMNSLDPNLFNIFLYHSPAVIEDVKNYSVDLQLAGHTHGGQVAVPFYGAIVTLTKHGKKYEAGLYNVDDTILYVNRGIGMEGSRAPRVRFCARPEITVFEITPQK